MSKYEGEIKSVCFMMLEACDIYRVFSRDVTGAAMLVSPTNPLGIELYYHANVLLCFGGKTRLLIT